MFARALKLYVVFLVSLVVFLCAPLVFADPATPGGVIVQGIGTNPSDPDFFANVFSAIAAHNWRYVAAMSVIAFTWLLRSVLAEKVPALKKGKWAWTVAVLGSALAALSTHLLSNAPTGGVVGVASVLLYGAFVGLAATGMFKGFKEFKNDQ